MQVFGGFWMRLTRGVCLSLSRLERFCEARILETLYLPYQPIKLML